MDYPADPGCADENDDDEHSPSLACDDGIDNDNDGLIDYKADGSGDPGCAWPTWSTESPECDDGIDNDGDGLIDFDGGVSATRGAVHGTPDPNCMALPTGSRTTRRPRPRRLPGATAGSARSWPLS